MAGTKSCVTNLTKLQQGVRLTCDKDQQGYHRLSGQQALSVTVELQSVHRVQTAVQHVCEGGTRAAICISRWNRANVRIRVRVCSTEQSQQRAYPALVSPEGKACISHHLRCFVTQYPMSFKHYSCFHLHSFLLVWQCIKVEWVGGREHKFLSRRTSECEHYTRCTRANLIHIKPSKISVETIHLFFSAHHHSASTAAVIMLLLPIAIYPFHPPLLSPCISLSLSPPSP